ncbi:DUF885 domain-containing protein [Burkholderia ubonensis]|uniref:DUF885 domain-containing protein n=1 Tax=Burkholderia ubonensis TaxID=101571 RepID=UPI000BA52981|nr:DUF885 domain-containing protein [Burkholderia ubonensis]PAJ86388.1 hypothetical protein CJO70_17475 [Burkholderia ubonensis]PAJ93392.1 hypothetical protein CJO69_17065 [Burkholderia ubonensis]PAK06393.1 hypothetical protein CJO67_18690 [Burkholderia ubonensis]PAK12171.1 hypothetical protein CJO66_23985 [Burkholderia ubonensis]RQP31434.1 DUF885 domain-containing protein [Burkholderia ubonensis]
MTMIGDIGAELLDLRIAFDPLDDALRMVSMGVHAFPDMSDESLSEMARRLSTLDTMLQSGEIEGDAHGIGVARQQARDLGQRIDMRLWATFVSGYDHSPLGRISGGLSQISMESETQSARFEKLLLSAGRFIDSCIPGTVTAARTGRAPIEWSVREAIRQWESLLSEDGAALIPEATCPARRTVLMEQFIEHVGPSVREYIHTLKDVVLPLARSDEQPGLCHITSGSNQYEQLVASHTDDFGTIDEIHRLGESEVARIHDRISAITGLDPRDLQAFLVTQERSPSALAFAQADDVRAYVERAVERARSDFSRVVDMTCVGELAVVDIPEHLSNSSPIAYYLPGDRPDHGGQLRLNVQKILRANRGISLALLAHEGIPGHHVQFEYARQAALPPFLASAWFNSFIEGWGLYAEELASEAGYYQDPVESIGKLRMELLRAARLVVDTGIHSYGWTSARASEYLQNFALLSANIAMSEVRRYTEYPAQALSYTTGKLKLLALRDAQRNALSSEFDLWNFHSKLLKFGAAPVSVLSREFGKITS